VAVHPAELLLGFEHAGRVPTQRHLTVELALHVGQWSRQISIMDSMALVERNVRASVGGTPSRLKVNVSAGPLRSEAERRDGSGRVWRRGPRGHLGRPRGSALREAAAHASLDDLGHVLGRIATTLRILCSSHRAITGLSKIAVSAVLSALASSRTKWVDLVTSSPRSRCPTKRRLATVPFAVEEKTVSRRLSRAEVELYEDWIANRRQLKGIVAEMEETSVAAGAILLRQATQDVGPKDSVSKPNPDQGKVGPIWATRSAERQTE